MLPVQHICPSWRVFGCCQCHRQQDPPVFNCHDKCVNLYDESKSQSSESTDENEKRFSVEMTERLELVCNDG